MAYKKLVLQGLSDLDEEELREAIGTGNADFSRAAAKEGALPEPATITAIITLTPVIVSALTVYLSKGRRRTIIRKKHKLIRADGSVEESEFEFDDASQEAVKAGILKQLQDWIGGGQTPPVKAEQP